MLLRRSRSGKKIGTDPVTAKSKEDSPRERYPLPGLQPRLLILFMLKVPGKLENTVIEGK